MLIDLYDILSFFGIAVVLTAIFTRATIWWATARGIVDKPTGGRKIHSRPIPLLGGIPIIVSFIATLFIAQMQFDVFEHIATANIQRIIIATAIIVLAGYIDDAYSARPLLQIVSIVAAAGIVSSTGLGLHYITDPDGGLIDLTQLTFLGLPIASLIVFGWIMAMSATTKLLDGLDGLVTGIVAIGAILIAAFSLISKYFQPDVAMIAGILGGACLGFLLFNKHPARIFLGNIGSIWLGFILGVLAVISGGKIAIALLVLGVPFIDMLVVIARRITYKRSPLKGDGTHLHFRLMRRIGHKNTVYLYWAIAAAFGGLTIIAQSTQKIIAFGVLIIFTLLTTLIIAHTKKPTSDKKHQVNHSLDRKT